MQRDRFGFTLIELLVVVTIIVVLLALLTPALDKAIYAADLAVCGSKLHAIASGAIMYTQNSKRRWPDRPARRSNGSNRPIDLYYGLNQLHDLDDRLILKQFISINKTLNCPLVKPVDIEGSDVNGAALSPYGLYFGWGLEKAKRGDKGMFKLGDRWTYTDAGNGSTAPVIESFSVIASDWDSLYTNSNTTYGTHPDRGGAMIPYYSQDQGGAGFVGSATFSYWIAIKRPPVDLNFGYDDGSVIRVNDVAWDEGSGQPPAPDSTGGLLPPAATTPGGNIDRMVRVPQTDVDNQPNWKFRLPRR